MAEEIEVSPVVLQGIRSALGHARDGLEHCAGSAPPRLDAGELTAVLAAMMARVLDDAAAVSEALGAVAAQVGEAGTEFWEVDSVVASSYVGPAGAR